MTQYRFNKDGNPIIKFIYKWNTVEWDLGSKPIYSCSDIANKLKKHFGRYWDVDNKAIEQYFTGKKGRNIPPRWPSLGVCDSQTWGECKNGLSEANYQKVLEVFESNTYPKNYKESASNDEPLRKRRPCRFPTTNKSDPLFTQFEDWEIVKDGMTTPEAAEYLNSCNLGRTYDANSVKDMCRDGRIPSAKIGDRHKVHKTNLDELVAEARRIIPTPPPAEDKQEQPVQTDTEQARRIFDDDARNLLKRCEQLIRAATEETDKAVGEAHDSIVLNVREMILPLRNAQKKDRASLERVLYLVTNLYHLLDVPVPENTKESDS